MERDHTCLDISSGNFQAYLGYDVLSMLNSLLAKSSKKMFVIDEQVNELYGDSLQRVINDTGNASDIYREIISGDEHSKTMTMVDYLYHQALNCQMNRSSWFIAIGGGVIGDLTGFVSATYMRGTNFLLVPTTLLSQVDSCVGGKVAVNLEHYKNMVGTFYHPRSVIADLKFLTTLNKRELLSGLAEIIKYGILCDREMFFDIKRNLENLLSADEYSSPKYLNLVRRSIQIKDNIVLQDEQDYNIRQVLNLGHTFAHVLEGATHYNYFKHGEAVLWGIAFASQLSLEKGIINYSEYTEIRELLLRLPLPKIPDSLRDFSVLRSHILRDKKNAAKGPTVIVPERIGKAKIIENITVEELTQIIVQNSF